MNQIQYIKLGNKSFEIKNNRLEIEGFPYGADSEDIDNFLLSLKSIKNLKEFYFWEFFGGLDCLKSLNNLEVLELPSNYIDEMKGIEVFTNLKKLVLHYYGLSSQEEGIKEISGLDNLINLEYLEISNNKIREIKGQFTNSYLIIFILDFQQLDIKNLLIKK